MIAVVRPSIGTVRNQRASLGPLDHLGPCLSLRSLGLPPCEDPLLRPHADLRGICACTAAAEVASRGRSTTLPEAVSALHCLIRDQYVTPDAPELRHVIPESILYCARTLLLALGRCDAEERIKTWLWLLGCKRQTASAPFNSARWQQFACSSANTSHASCGSLGTCSRQARQARRHPIPYVVLYLYSTVSFKLSPSRVGFHISLGLNLYSVLYSFKEP